MILKPQALRPGDVIRVVASASPFEEEAFHQGVRLLEGMGFAVRYQKNIFAKKPYLAGDDKRRLAELVSALQDQEARAILFARGGYGSMRLLCHLHKMRLNLTPKILLGYSDITSLLVYFYQRLGWITFYGPVVAKDLCGQTDPLTQDALRAALTNALPLGEMRFAQTVALKKGQAQGPLVGGCLSLIVAHMGTPYDLNTDGRILFLEDINEKPYAVDRMLTQMKMGGKFKKCRGVVFGSLAGPNPPEHYKETIADIFKEYDFPVLFNFPAGHSEPKITLPLGVKAALSSKRGAVTFLESALAPTIC